LAPYFKGFVEIHNNLNFDFFLALGNELQKLLIEIYNLIQVTANHKIDFTGALKKKSQVPE